MEFKYLASWNKWSSGWFCDQSKEHLPPSPSSTRRPSCWRVRKHCWMNKITFKLVQGGNSGAHGLPVQLNIPAAGRFSQMLPRNAFLDCLEEGAMDYLLFSQGSGDPAEILLIQLSPGKGRLPLPKRMNFRKSSKRSLTPPPHFSENHIANFSWNSWPKYRL